MSQGQHGVARAPLVEGAREGFGRTEWALARRLRMTRIVVVEHARTERRAEAGLHGEIAVVGRVDGEPLFGLEARCVARVEFEAAFGEALVARQMHAFEQWNAGHRSDYDRHASLSHLVGRAPS